MPPSGVRTGSPPPRGPAAAVNRRACRAISAPSTAGSRSGRAASEAALAAAREPGVPSPYARSAPVASSAISSLAIARWAAASATVHSAPGIGVAPRQPASRATAASPTSVTASNSAPRPAPGPCAGNGTVMVENHDRLLRPCPDPRRCPSRVVVRAASQVGPGREPRRRGGSTASVPRRAR